MTKLINFLKKLLNGLTGSYSRRVDSDLLLKIDQLLESVDKELRKLDAIDSTVKTLVSCKLNQYENLVSNIRDCLDELENSSKRHLGQSD